MTVDELLGLLQKSYRCPMCKGSKKVPGLSWDAPCSNCQGKGYIELSKDDAFMVALKYDLLVPSGFVVNPNIEEMLEDLIYGLH